MPRSRRIALIGHPHLVTARANHGRELFGVDDDYVSYLELLRELGREGMFALYAYCLMKRELRLVIEPLRVGLAQTMQRLNGSHALRVNHREQCRGHLFEGRFDSIILPREQLRFAVRDVHLWPVRTGRVRRTATYPWSSHRSYVSGGDEWGDLVDAWTVLEPFGATLPVAQRAFARFVESAALEPTQQTLPVAIPGVAGDRRFAEAVLAEAGVVWRRHRRPALKTLARRVSLLLGVETEDLTCASRKQDLVLARRLFATTSVRKAGRTVTEVAQFLRRDKAQVSRLVAQGMELIQSDETFRALVDQVSGRVRETPVKD